MVYALSNTKATLKAQFMKQLSKNKAELKKNRGASCVYYTGTNGHLLKNY